MNTEESFDFLEKKEDELREVYLDLLEENAKLKEEIKRLNKVFITLGGGEPKRRF